MEKNKKIKEKLDELVCPQDLIGYNELMYPEKILDLYNNKQLKIKLNDLKWDKEKQLTFIDSLNKNIHTPTITLAYNYKTKKYIVIDGTQRLITIIKYLQHKELFYETYLLYVVVLRHEETEEHKKYLEIVKERLHS